MLPPRILPLPVRWSFSGFLAGCVWVGGGAVAALLLEVKFLGTLLPTHGSLWFHVVTIWGVVGCHDDVVVM